MITGVRKFVFRKYFKHLLCFFLTFYSYFLFSQKNHIDSLRQLLLTDQPDTNKAIHSYKLCWEYTRKGLYDSAMLYGKAALTLSEQLNFEKGIAGAHGNIGNAFYEQGEYPQALDNYYKALKVAEEAGDQKAIVRWLGNIGVVYTRMGDYLKAIDNNFRILSISEKLNDKRILASTYNNIGIIYKFKGNYIRALDYFSKALDASEDLRDKYLIANNLGNIGVIYENTHEYNKSLDYLLKALKIAEQLGENKIIASTYDNIGNVYSDQKKYEQALNYYLKALKLDEKLKNKNGIAIKLGNIGALYTSIKEYDKAEEYLLRSLNIAEEIQNLSDVKAAKEYLSELYTQKGDYEKALEYYKGHVVAKDSIFDEQKNEEIIQKEMSYEFSKKELAAKAEHDRLILEQETEKKKQQIVFWFIIGGLLLSLIFGAFIFRSLRITKKQKTVIESQKEKTEQQNEEIRRQKELVEEKNKIIENKNKELNQQNKEITVQRDKLVENLKYTEKLQETLKNDLSHYRLISLRKLMNPHFIFNSLNSIQSFILQNDKLKASLYLSKFSGLIRKVLEQSQMEYITLSEELETLSVYIELESQRFVEKFTSSLIIEPDIKTDNYLVPPLIFQPFVENAIWHGLMQKENGGKVTISIKLHNNSLHCTIEDNGIGRDASMKINKNRKERESFGIKATGQRLKILNSLNNSDMVLTYTDLQDSAGKALGTKVEFFLPCLIQNNL
jgi:sensor histidine kinase YesM